MIRTALALLGALAVTNAAVSVDMSDYGFSMCYNNKRSAFVGPECPESGILKCAPSEPTKVTEIKGLTCAQDCEPGWYLDWSGNLTNPTSNCRQCPMGTYTVGGGTLYSGRAQIWKALPSEFRTECIWFDGQRWHHGRCNSWTPESNGTIISSGDNSMAVTKGNIRTQSTLLLNADFVKEGHVRFRYKVDGQDGHDGLQFILDVTVQKWEGKKVTLYQQKGWAETVIKVSKGAHTLKWRYEKDEKGDYGADKAFIEIVEVYGTKHSDRNCESCYLGFSNKCRVCERDHYADDKQMGFEVSNLCASCPEGRFSADGAVGVNECLQKQDCTEDDLVPTKTECGTDTHTTDYEWIQPQICANKNSKLELSVTFNGKCTPCDPGYIMHRGKHNCEACPRGTIPDNSAASMDTSLSTGRTPSVCMQCPSGRYSENKLVLGPRSRYGWQGVQNPGHALYEGVVQDGLVGWALGHNDLAESNAHTKRGDEYTEQLETIQNWGENKAHGAAYDDDQQLVLPIRVNLINSGTVSFTYEISGAVATIAAIAHSNANNKNAIETAAKLTSAFSVQSFQHSSPGTSGRKLPDDSSNPIMQPMTSIVSSDDVYALEGADGVYNATFDLCPGEHMLRWVWRRQNVPKGFKSATDKMTLHALSVTGVETTAGGAPHACPLCPAGQEVDPDGGVATFDTSGTQSVGYHVHDRCRFCPTGRYAPAIAKGPDAGLSSAQECISCPNGYFSKEGAAACTPCGLGTDSNKDHSECAVDEYLEVSAELVFNMTALQTLSDNPQFGGGAAALFTGMHLNRSELVTVSAGRWSDGSPRLVQLGALEKGHAQVPHRVSHLGEHASMAHLNRAVGGVVQQTTQCARGSTAGEERYGAYAVLLKQTNYEETQHADSVELEYDHSTVVCSAPPTYEVIDAGNVLHVGEGKSANIEDAVGHPFGTTFDAKAADDEEDYVGLTARYTDGARDVDCPSGRETTVHFRCDANVEDGGMPSFVRESRASERDKEVGCRLVFEWITQAACPMCTVAHYKQRESECTEDGSQLITYDQRIGCVGGVPAPPPKSAKCFETSASDYDSVMGGTLFIVCMVAIGAAVVLYRKYKHTQNTFNEYINSRGRSSTDKFDSGSKGTPTANGGSVVTSSMHARSNIEMQDQVEVDLGGDDFDLGGIEEERGAI
jgi:hypothetical protein